MTLLAKKVLFGLLVLLQFTQISNAQIDKTLNARELLIKGFEYLQDEDTAKTLEYFMAIHPNDTAFTLAANFIDDILDAQGRYNEQLIWAQKGLAKADDEESNFYINVGNSYLNLEKYEEALSTYQEGIKKYPFNHVLHFNSGIANFHLKNYDAYLAALKKTVSIYPFYPNAHRELGSLAENNGRTTQALMSYMMSILTDPGSQASNNMLIHMDELVTDKLEVEEDGYNFPEGEDDYSEVDLIIANRVALQKGYKLKSKAKLSLVKQLQVLMETIEYDPSDEGYWMKTYVKFFKNLWDEEYFEGFSYYILKASSNTKHQRLVKRKKKHIQKFSTWAGDEINAYFNSLPITIEGKTIVTERRYGAHGSDALSSVGKVENDMATGCWYHLHASGAIRGKGCFDNVGKSKGNWTWYDEKGNIERNYDVADGDLNGLFVLYYGWNEKFKEIEFVDDNRQGLYKEYYKNGGLYAEQNYEENVLEGINKYYHRNGSPKFYFNRVEGELDGTFKRFYPNGQLMYISSYTEGKLDSIETTYYWDGQIKTEAVYVEGERNGPYTDYFPNGKIERKGSFVEDAHSGENLDYFSNGNLYQKNTYDVDGKKTGLAQEFDKDGIKYLEYDYKKGNIVAYRVYDKSGKILRSAKKKGGDFQYEGAYPDGTVKSKGIYDSKGGQQGSWQYFDRNGNLSREVEFDDGDAIGLRTDYYSNGQTEEESSFEENVWEGVSKIYHQNGQLSSEYVGEAGNTERSYVALSVFGDTLRSMFYQQGELNGWQYYYANTGKLDTKKYYDFGVLLKEVYCDTNGMPMDTLVYYGDKEMILHYPNGKVKFNLAYKGGLADGPATWYHPNGKVSVKGQYINGKRHGDWISYHLNDQIRQTYSYINGERTGETVRYHDNGKLKEKYNYKFDVLEGPNTYYNEKGIATTIYNYEMGFKHGESKFYDPNGVLDHIRVYHYNKIVGYSYLGKDGKPVPVIPIENETAVVKSYFQNGKLGREYSLKSGEFDSHYIEYYSSGQMADSSSNKDGWSTGESRVFYSNGALKQKTSFDFDEVVGPSFVYYKNGKIKEERHYLKGYGHGTWKFFDTRGKLTKEYYYYNGDLMDVKIY